MKKGKISSVIMVFIYLLGFGGIGFLGGNLFSDEENFGIFLIKAICAGIVAGLIMFIHILFHETGHFIFGLLTGYQFNSFRIFNMMWQRDDDGKIRLYHFSVAGTGGQCIMSPPEIKDGKMPFFWYNIGGVFMNFAIAVLFLILYFCLKDNPYFEFISLSFVVLGISIGLANAVPLPELTNDGRNLVELAKSDKAKKVFYLQMKAIVMMQKGVRIKDFPSEWFEMPTDEELKNTMCSVMAVFVCDRLFDEGKYAEVQTLIDTLLQKETAVNHVHRELLKANALFCELTGSKNKSKIENYLDNDLKKFMKAMQNYPSIIRTKYAYELLYNNNMEEAEKQLALFEKTALTYPYKVEIETERECMNLAGKLDGHTIST